jgi:hypothetical protein
MARIPQGAKPKGSQHWLQVIANTQRGLFDKAIRQAGITGVEWLSPLKTDDYAEYQDEDFLKLLGIELPRRSLKSFWPARGPVWDGLARSSSHAALLIEAKANLPELESPASEASPESAALIAQSMDEAKPAFGAPKSAEWTKTYYQYANRLAHLYFLRECNKVDAFLVFLYFTGAKDVGGPAGKSEWTDAIRAAHQALQIGEGTLTPFVVDLFIDVSNLAGS